MDNDEVFEYPVDGVLDLHTFRPSDVKDLLPEYIAACRRKGILQLRIIHGKGTGTLKKMITTMLSRMPEVASFRQASEDAGGWGATLVTLKP